MGLNPSALPANTHSIKYRIRDGRKNLWTFSRKRHSSPISRSHTDIHPICWIMRWISCFWLLRSSLLGLTPIRGRAFIEQPFFLDNSNKYQRYMQYKRGRSQGHKSQLVCILILFHCYCTTSSSPTIHRQTDTEREWIWTGFYFIISSYVVVRTWL